MVASELVENCSVATPESVLTLQVTGEVSSALSPQTAKLKVQSPPPLVSVKLIPASVAWKTSPDTDLVVQDTSVESQSALPASLQTTPRFSVPLHTGVP